MSNYFDKYKRTFNYDIGRMVPMPESPFSFRADDSFRNLVESIRQYGLLEPIVVIPHREYSGKYEIVSRSLLSSII
ncbi:MAG: ParB N-terminal domain-containing protein [Clostridia bacterium]|nr:ParB N-terminal domain-containing protein [Clostridia bacterium]